MCQPVCLCCVWCVPPSGLLEVSSSAIAEASVANLVKPYTQVLDLAKFSAAHRAPSTMQGVIETCRAGRAPPLSHRRNAGTLRAGT